MKAEYQKVTTVTLKLDEKEAMWLKGYVQSIQYQKVNGKTEYIAMGCLDDCGDVVTQSSTISAADASAEAIEQLIDSEAK